MINEILINIIAIVAVLAVLFFLLKKPINNYLSNLGEVLAEKNLKMIEERNREILKEERERMGEMNDEKMKRNDQYM